MKIVAEDTRALCAEKRAQLTARLREEVERAELLRLINRTAGMARLISIMGRERSI